MVQTRKELIEHFTAFLQGYYAEFTEETRTRNGWLKTQILELDEVNKPSQVQDIFKGFAAENDNLSFSELNDELFYCIKTGREENDCIYVDALDTRFVVLYSALHSKPFDDVVDLLTRKPSIDRAWFPQDFMSSLDTLGLFKGYGGRFNNQYFIDVPNERLDDNPKYRSLSFKSWGHTKRLLMLIQSDEELKDEFALTNMRVKVAYDAKDDADTAIDDITYSGRITSLGRSFRAHHNATIRIKEAYRKLVVDTIESTYSIKYIDNSLVGEKLVFLFSRELEDLADFAGRLFSGKKPFRLWGLETVSKENFVRLEVVDLHVHDRFMVEVHPNRLVVLITKGVCGNTVLRLLTLLQQSLNSSVSLISPEGEVVDLRVRNG